MGGPLYYGQPPLVDDGESFFHTLYIVLSSKPQSLIAVIVGLCLFLLAVDLLRRGLVRYTRYKSFRREYDSYIGEQLQEQKKAKKAKKKDK